jgi:hypothetical protein
LTASSGAGGANMPRKIRRSAGRGEQNRNSRMTASWAVSAGTNRLSASKKRRYTVTSSVSRRDGVNHQFQPHRDAGRVTDFPLSLRIYDELTIAKCVGNMQGCSVAPA